MAKENKRKSIRVKDKLLMSFTKVSKEEFKAKVNSYIEGSDDPWDDLCHPVFLKDIKKPLKNLREKDKDLAAILEAIDQKLNLLLGMVGSEDSQDATDSIPKKIYKVDLSAEGIGFFTSQPLEVGDILELSLGLLPEHYFFTCFGQVVRTEKRNGRQFVGVKFAWITEDDREKLIEHIFSRQVIQLRMRRQKRNSDE